MADAGIVRPLTNSQKLFLQRLMVAHVLTDEKAKELHASICDKFANVYGNEEEDEESNGPRDQGYMGRDLTHCLGIINGSLVPGFNLEIRTVSLPPPYDPDNPEQSPTEDESPNQKKGRHSSGANSKRPALVKYHAVVNRSKDDVARQYAFPLSRGGPHELAYFRLVFERLVERGMESIEEEGVGCPGSLNKMDLINLRMEMEGPHQDKLTIGQTEAALEMLEREGWLVPAAPPLEDDDEEEDDDEGNGDDDEEKPKKRKKKKRPTSSGGNKRKSLRGTFFGIGPRSFMELGEFLQQLGLPQDRMPQSILHRA